jgi:serine/threonine-protein kinase
MTLADRYRVQRKLGEGAFGAVYLCEDQRGGPPVALKVLMTAHRDEAAAARFQREAETALTLRHPRLISLLDSGVVEGNRPYLAFEYVDGQDLARFLRSHGRPERDQAVRWLRHLSQALGACHGAGIVHRDIKPGNIYLDDQGGIQLGDFGLAVRQDTARQLTRTGELVGTPLYASPELLRGERPGPRADLWSVGAVGYELLYGRPWRSATDLGALGRDAMAKTVPLEEESRLGHLPELDPWLHRMLAQSPDERFEDARDARKALEEATSQKSSEVLERPPRLVPSPDSPGKSLMPMVWVLVFACVVGGMLTGSPPGGATPPTPTPVSSVEALAPYPPELLTKLEAAAAAIAPGLAVVDIEGPEAKRDSVVQRFLDPAFPLRVRRWLRACAAAASEGLDVHEPARWRELAVAPGHRLVAQSHLLPDLLDRLVMQDPEAVAPEAASRGRRARAQAAELSTEAQEHLGTMLGQGRREGVDHHLAGLSALTRHPVGGALAEAGLARLGAATAPTAAREELESLRALVGYLPDRRTQPEAVEHHLEAGLTAWSSSLPEDPSWEGCRILATQLVEHLSTRKSGTLPQP